MIFAYSSDRRRAMTARGVLAIAAVTVLAAAMWCARQTDQLRAALRHHTQP